MTVLAILTALIATMLLSVAGTEARVEEARKEIDQ